MCVYCESVWVWDTRIKSVSLHGPFRAEKVEGDIKIQELSIPT